VLDKIVSREANVRAAANRVALGEADATFVYTSDATTDIEDRVRIVDIPEGVNVIATYPIAAASASQNPQLAQAWVDLVLSEEGQRVLEENGFLPAGRSRGETDRTGSAAWPWQRWPCSRGSSACRC